MQCLHIVPLTAGPGWRRRGGEGWEEVERGKEIDHHPSGIFPQLFLRKCWWQRFEATYIMQRSEAGRVPSGPVLPQWQELGQKLSITLLKTIKVNISSSLVRRWKFTFQNFFSYWFGFIQHIFSHWFFSTIEDTYQWFGSFIPFITNHRRYISMQMCF